MDIATFDDNFAWTDASSDSDQNMAIEDSQTDSKHEMKYNDISKNLCLQQKQTSKKKKKQVVSEECANNHNDLNSSIKSESNSDYDIRKSEKKIKCERTILNSNFIEPDHETEDYLNLRVKEEQATFVQPALSNPKKKKKSKRKAEIDEFEESDISIQCKTDVDEHSFNDASLVSYEYSDICDADTSHKKKKKKKKHSEDYSTSELTEESGDSHKKKKISLVHNTITRKGSLNYHSHVDDIKSSTLIKNSENDDDASTLPNDTELVDHISIIEGPLKRPRISDRIQFEEDSTNFETKDKVLPDLSIQLQQFTGLNAHLTQIHSTGPKDSIISSDDEMWVVKGPHNLAVDDFEKTTLLLDSKRKVKINGISYDSIVDNSVCTAPTLLLHKKNILIKNVPLRGVITLRNRIPKVHIPYESLMVNTDSDFIPLPDTKCRHPLFGVHYKKASKIPKAIAERLNVSVSSHVPIDIVKKKKKKHKVKERFKTESDLEVKPDVDMLQSHKRKRKHSDEKSVQKAKRLKLEPDDTDAWTSERAIESNLFNF